MPTEQYRDFSVVLPDGSARDVSVEEGRASLLADYTNQAEMNWGSIVATPGYAGGGEDFVSNSVAAMGAITRASQGYDPATDMDNPFSVGGSDAQHTTTANTNQSRLTFDAGTNPITRPIAPREQALDAGIGRPTSGREVVFDNGTGDSGDGGGGSGGGSGVGSGGSSDGSDTQSPFNRLADLMAAQYAAGGGGSGGGMVALPTTISGTGSSSSSTGMLTVAVIIAVVVGAIWYYKKYHKAAAT